MASLIANLTAIKQQLSPEQLWRVDGDTRINPPTIIAVSKTVPAEIIEQAINLGLTDFGENKIQEAQAKWPQLKAKYPQIRLHLIGPLQSNKAKAALELFDVVHTIDRLSLIQEITKISAQKNIVTKQFLLQVNTGEEPQKAGVIPTELPQLLAICNEHNLPVSGLMCIPPATNPAAPHFALLSKLAKRHNFRELSMGMSGDYQVAARLGATMVRIGTALFGAR